jgi:hypothetical protein
MGKTRRALAASCGALIAAVGFAASARACASSTSGPLGGLPRGEEDAFLAELAERRR